jgi:hypothetical protein
MTGPSLFTTTVLFLCTILTALAFLLNLAIVNSNIYFETELSKSGRSIKLFGWLFALFASAMALSESIAPRSFDNVLFVVVALIAFGDVFLGIHLLYELDHESPARNRKLIPKVKHQQRSGNNRGPNKSQAT